MTIQLSDHFTYKKLLRFTLSSIVMMVFTSIYGVVDGIFVSNLAGTTAFAALNLIMPVCMLPGAIGFMIGTGGSALVARLLGEGHHTKANRVFSMLIYISAMIGAVVSLAALIFLKPIAMALGAEGEILEHSVTYGRILLIATVPFILQNEFQSFLITAEKPQFGLAVTISAGVTNIILDAVLVGILDCGLIGAGIATAISEAVGCLVPLMYFILSKNSILRLADFTPDVRSLLKVFANGSSEMMTHLSMTIVNILYNLQLISLAGERGIAAYGAIMYVNFIFISIFIGYSIGCAPIISYHFGAQHKDELKSLRQKSLRILGVASLSMTVLSLLLSAPLAYIFTGYDNALYSMTYHAFLIYSLSYLFAGFNIFGSSFFTALNNGPVSALISFTRTLVFQILAVSLLPMLFGLNGVWWAVNAAEFGALIITATLMIVFRSRYKY